MIDSIDELNKCVESISIISGNIGKICIIIYDISVGNKFIKKDKNGKIIICNKSKLYSGYKDKIDELKNKVKKYEKELKKIKVKTPKKKMMKHHVLRLHHLIVRNHIRMFHRMTKLMKLK